MSFDPDSATARLEPWRPGASLAEWSSTSPNQMPDCVQREGSSTLTVESRGRLLAVHLSGSGIPLIALHGLGSDSRDMGADLGQLAGFRLALLDQRGHGSSSLVADE